MDRRQFLHCLGLGTLSASLARGHEGAGATRTIHWAWVTARADQSRDALQRQFDDLRRGGVTAVLVGGSHPEGRAIARAAGLEVHAWMWTLCRGDLLETLPHCYAVSREGRSTSEHPPYVPYYRFLCPNRPEVRAHLRAEVTALATDGDLTGIHLDYVRFPDVILPRGLWQKYDLVQERELPPFDFCYCETCRAAFREQAGVDPLRLEDPSASAAWRQFRWDAITGLVTELAAAVRPTGRLLTAAVFPTPTIARRLVRQDWTQWPLDAVLPMVYHGFYEREVSWVETAVREGVTALQGARPLYAGLYLPQIASDEELAVAVAGARRGGAAGVALFGGVRDLTAIDAW